MMLHWNKKQTTVHILLDTGCSVPLISKNLTNDRTIPTLSHEKGIDIGNFSGNIVKGVGEHYTLPLLLQHRKHYT
jgi:hypothetical protein